VSAGDNSKELEVQTQRNRREKETFYASQKDIPFNPKDPWDLEMDFDDSLTPEIPIDQAPDADTMETDSVCAAPNAAAPVEDKQIGSMSSTSVAVADGANGEDSEPDLELLTVLLKNPQLVFALTSNSGENVSSEQTVALLDTLKRTGLGLSELVNTLGNGAGAPKEPEPEPIPASLPSPTPSDRTARVCLLAFHVTQCYFSLKLLIRYSLAGCLGTGTRDTGDGSKLAAATLVEPGEYTSYCKYRAAKLLKCYEFVTLTTLCFSFGFAATDSS
jgi:hypothetical protein